MATTHRRGNRDGLHLGSSMGRGRHGAALVFGFNTDVPFPLVFGVLGFIAGITFSVVLMLFERRRALEQMTSTRFASWGALSGFLLSAIFARLASLGAGDVFMIAPTFAIACAVCASGSLAMAKRAERRELPGSREGSAPAQLRRAASPPASALPAAATRPATRASERSR